MGVSLRRARALRLIRKNIAVYGYHLYVIFGEQTPRYAYTIGLTERELPELVLPGCLALEMDALHASMEAIVESYISVTTPPAFVETHLGHFALTTIDSSWSDALLSGLIDYYGRETSNRSLQLRPTTPHMLTIDVPDMTAPLTQSAVWTVDDRTWRYSVPRDSCALVDLSVARGLPVTQCTRSDTGVWQMWAEDSFNLTTAHVRVIPLGTLLTYDPNLEFVTELQVGECVSRRNPEGEWREALVIEVRD